MTRKCAVLDCEEPVLEGEPYCKVHSAVEKKPKKTEGLSKEYVEQLKKQLDVKFALTLKFMNSSDVLEETIRKSPNEIKNLTDKERQKILITVENASKFADVLAKEICPITAK